MNFKYFISSAAVLCLVHSGDASSPPYLATGFDAMSVIQDRPLTWTSKYIPARLTGGTLEELLEDLKEAKDEVLKYNIYNDIDNFIIMDNALASERSRYPVTFKAFYERYRHRPEDYGEQRTDIVGLVRKVVDKVTAKEKWESLRDEFYMAAVTEAVAPRTVEKIKKLDFFSQDNLPIHQIVGALILEDAVVLIDMERAVITSHETHSGEEYDLKSTFRYFTTEMPMNPGCGTLVCVYTNKYTFLPKSRSIRCKSKFLLTSVQRKLEREVVLNRVFRLSHVERGLLGSRYVVANFYRNEDDGGERLDTTDLIDYQKSLNSVDEFVKTQLMRTPIRMMVKVGEGEFEVDNRNEIPTGELAAFVFVKMFDSQLGSELDDIFTVGYTDNEDGEHVLKVATFSKVELMTEEAEQILLVVHELLLFNNYAAFKAKLQVMQRLVDKYELIFRSANNDKKPNPLLATTLRTRPMISWFLQHKGIPKMTTDQSI